MLCKKTGGVFPCLVLCKLQYIIAGVVCAKAFPGGRWRGIAAPDKGDPSFGDDVGIVPYNITFSAHRRAGACSRRGHRGRVFPYSMLCKPRILVRHFLCVVAGAGIARPLVRSPTVAVIPSEAEGATHYSLALQYFGAKIPPLVSLGRNDMGRGYPAR